MAHGVVPIVYPTPGTTFHLINEYNGFVAQCSSISSRMPFENQRKSKPSLVNVEKREYVLGQDRKVLIKSLYLCCAVPDLLNKNE